MKNWKMLVGLVVATSFFVGCPDATDPKKIARDRDLTWNERTLVNSYGGSDALSGVDLVNDVAFNASIGTDGWPDYVDSSIVDVPTINSISRATTLSSKITTLNGAKFVKATLRDFEKLSKRQLENAGDDAVLDTIDLADCVDADDSKRLSYFIARLSGVRGTVLVRASLDLERDGTSTTNVGFIDLEYVRLADADEVEESN